MEILENFKSRFHFKKLFDNQVLNILNIFVVFSYIISLVVHYENLFKLF